VNAAKKAASADFAKLVEMFDEHGVPFVSVTQSFNTTTSMRRLTLNVLLSFAQFERNFSLWSSIGSLRRSLKADWTESLWPQFCVSGDADVGGSIRFCLGWPKADANHDRSSYCARFGNGSMTGGNRVCDLGMAIAVNR
jgi:hypothetical protein